MARWQEASGEAGGAAGVTVLVGTQAGSGDGAPGAARLDAPGGAEQRRELPAPGGTCCSPGRGEAGTGRPGRRGRGHLGDPAGEGGWPAPGRKEAACLPWLHRRGTALSHWPGPPPGTFPAARAALPARRRSSKGKLLPLAVLPSVGSRGPTFPSFVLQGSRPVSPWASASPQQRRDFHLEFSHLHDPPLNFPGPEKNRRYSESTGPPSPCARDPARMGHCGPGKARILLGGEA